MNRISLVGLFKMELPGGDVRLCDGAFFEYDSETYENTDSTFGNIQAMEGMSEGLGDELPGLVLTFGPDGSASASDLNDIDNHGARTRFWIAEYDIDAGTISGTPELHFDGEIDRTVLKSGQNERTVEMDIISNVERLLLRQEGNSMSPRFHKSIWSGELGMDNAIDLEIPVAWGTESPRGTSTVSGGNTGFDPRFRYDLL